MNEVNRFLFKMWIFTSIIGLIIGHLIKYYFLNLSLQTILMKDLIGIPFVLISNFIFWYIGVRVVLFLFVVRSYYKGIDDDDEV